MASTPTIARRSHCNRCDQPYEYVLAGGTQYVCNNCLDEERTEAKYRRHLAETETGLYSPWSPDSAPMGHFS